MLDHWKFCWRDYYCRYDYEYLYNEQVAKIKDNANKSIETWKTVKEGNDDGVFEYNDSFDHRPVCWK